MRECEGRTGLRRQLRQGRCGGREYGRFVPAGIVRDYEYTVRRRGAHGCGGEQREMVADVRGSGRECGRCMQVRVGDGSFLTTVHASLEAMMLRARRGTHTGAMTKCSGGECKGGMAGHECSGRRI